MSDPVVEELLEKGARWLARFDETDYETGGSARQRWYLDRAGQMLDAVFPGWQEGITREHSNLIGKDEAATGVVGAPTCRLTVRSSWVPVEEGTDG